MLDSVGLSSLASAPLMRGFGRFNARGCWTLFLKEVLRFLKIFLQTVLSPVIMTVLFYCVFTFGPQASSVKAYPVFLASGLAMMAVIQNAFFNSSASLILSKMQSNIVDLVMAPLSPFEWVLAYSAAGVVRGVMVGLLCLDALALFIDIPLLHPGVAVFFAVAGSLFMALLGFIIGVWGDSFDHVGAIQNFIVMPATFFSGAFFPMASLPGIWGTVGRLNPFFYMIDGFRYGFTGNAESPLWIGIVFMATMNVVLFVGAVKMVASGFKLKK